MQLYPPAHYFIMVRGIDRIKALVGLGLGGRLWYSLLVSPGACAYEKGMKLRVC